MHKMFDLTRYQKDHTCRMYVVLLAVLSVKKGVSGCSEQLHVSKGACSKGSQRTAGAAGHGKRGKTERPSVSLYLNELLD